MSLELKLKRLNICCSTVIIFDLLVVVAGSEAHICDCSKACIKIILIRVYRTWETDHPECLPVGVDDIFRPIFPAVRARFILQISLPVELILEPSGRRMEEEQSY